jgi:hypothetical protein
MTGRGLTLLEVVLATALLTLAATGVASAVSAIARPAERPHAGFHHLAETVDEVLRDPVRYELDTAAIVASGHGTLDVDGASFQITLKARSGRGAWLEFAYNEQQVARWVRVPEVPL